MKKIFSPSANRWEYGPLAPQNPFAWAAQEMPVRGLFVTAQSVPEPGAVVPAAGPGVNPRALEASSHSISRGTRALSNSILKLAPPCSFEGAKHLKVPLGKFYPKD